MNRVRRRLFFVVFGVLAFGGAVVLTLLALSEGIDYFYSPSDLIEKQFGSERRMRLGGLVVEGSVRREGVMLYFDVTDGGATIPVQYQGMIPDLFRENQGVIADGHLGTDGVFMASGILAKHDENYVPRELVKTLEGQDHWFADKQRATIRGKETAP